MFRQSFFNLILSIVAWLLCSICTAQQYVVQGLQVADMEFEKKHFAKALETYQFYNSRGVEDARLNIQIARCHHQLRNFESAIAYFENALASNQSALEIEQEYIRCLMANEQYQKAKQRLALQPTDTLNANLIASCDSAIIWKNNPTCQVVNLSAVNSIYSEMAPAPYKDGIVFCTNRTGVSIQKQSERDGLPLYDLYTTTPNEKGLWAKPALFSSKLNSSQNEGPLCFNHTGDTVYFSRNYESSSQSHLKMYRSTKVGNRWSKPQSFMLNDTSASFAHPSISTDGKLFFFTSNMKGGFGGTDIYVCVLIDSSWSMPINLGSAINTAGNEIFPSVNLEGNLHFASDGHIGMGGFDVYISKQINGEWQSAENLKSPINSSADDFGYVKSQTGKAYFTSNRIGGKGDDDIYEVLFFK